MTKIGFNFSIIKLSGKKKYFHDIRFIKKNDLDFLIKILNLVVK
ncbi:hypothetical protein [Chryseobacterium sp. G0186]|nr:hypothetical protein [Chryseobacterium sp. G0186]